MDPHMLYGRKMVNISAALLRRWYVFVYLGANRERNEVALTQ
jgi:hypothetical protein